MNKQIEDIDTIIKHYEKGIKDYISSEYDYDTLILYSIDYGICNLIRRRFPLITAEWMSVFSELKDYECYGSHWYKVPSILESPKQNLECLQFRVNALNQIKNYILCSSKEEIPEG